MLFILASVAFLSALTAMRYAVQGREVVVPDVTGKRAGEAQQLLLARGIGMKVEDRIYSPLPVDEVVRQSPPPKMTVKKGQFAHVVLSLGPRKETVPQLDDRSLRAAQSRIAASRDAGGRNLQRLPAGHPRRHRCSSRIPRQAPRTPPART